MSYNIMNFCIFLVGVLGDGNQGFRILGKYSAIQQLQNIIYFINMCLHQFHRAFTLKDSELVNKFISKRNVITKIKS